MVMSKWQSDSKRAETRLFLNLDSKSEIFVCRHSFKALNAPKYRRVYQMDLPTVKYDVSAFTGKKNHRLLIKIEFCEKKWICVKNPNFEQKFIFHQISKIHEKWSKKVQFFQKKNKILFCSKKTSNYRELISKLALESPESTLCGRKALNAPKFNLTPEARLKAKNLVFGPKISRLFHLQISK